MPNARAVQKAALQDSHKVVSAAPRGKPKIGVEEFMAVAKRFGFSTATLGKIREAVEAEDWGAGPMLSSYYANMKETGVRRFERLARKTFGVDHAVGVSSGTAALHAAFVAAGVGPGTEVVCPAVGFCATPFAVIMAKGVPVFCDVDDTMTIDASKIEALITPRTVALAPTHVMGSVCDMDAIMKIARKHGLKVVEDSAQAVGALYKGRRTGSIGDLGCFSISAYKICGAGEGGLVITNDERLRDRVLNTVEAGGLWRPSRFAAPRYEGELFWGTNYRMSELEGVMDAEQIKKLPAVVRRFQTVSRRIRRRLRPFRGVRPRASHDPDGDINYLLRFFPEDFDLGRRIVEALRAEGIRAGMRGPDAAPDWHIYRHIFPIVDRTGPTPDACPFGCPIYLERGGRADGPAPHCPVADDLYDRTISASLNQWMSAGEARDFADRFNRALGTCCEHDDTAPSWV